MKSLLRSATGVFAVATLSLLVLAAIVSLVWTPHDPFDASAFRAWQPPSFDFWLGTDASGRDTFSLLLAGSRVTVVVALGAAVFAGGLGILIAVAGALGRTWLREPIAVLIDVLIAFPTLLIAMMLSALVGGSLAVVIIAVGIGFGVSIGRVLRAEIRQVASLDFVTAARAAGATRSVILRRHILPNVSPVFLVQLSLSMGLAVLAEAGLSYLGFGAPPSVPSWGRMLAESQTYISVHPGSVLWPGLTITITVLALSLLGDTLRDVLDPQLTRGLRAKRSGITNTGVFAR